MKLGTCIFMICLSLAAAEPPKKKAPAPMTVPPDAVLVEPSLYHWIDPQGKGWMYRRGLFGVTRWADTAPDTKQQSIIETTNAFEQGDTIRFERESPFGKRIWTKKKAELDPTEQKIWERQQEKTSAARSAEKE